MIPRYQRGAVTVWLVLCVWSQERSNLFLPGFDRPLNRQSFGTVHLLENFVSEGIGDSRLQVKEPSLFASSRKSRRSESNRLALGYGPSVLRSGPRRRVPLRTNRPKRAARGGLEVALVHRRSGHGCFAGTTRTCDVGRPLVYCQVRHHGATDPCGTGVATGPSSLMPR